MTQEIKDLRENRSQNYLLRDTDKCVIDEEVLTENEKIFFKNLLGKVGVIKSTMWCHGYLRGYCTRYVVSFDDFEDDINAEVLKLAA